MNFIQIQHSPLQEIIDPILSSYGVKLFVKRDDLLHPLVSGNKWRKLKYNLIEAKRLGFKTILSFGGAFSNHIFAVAAACKAENLNSIGIIRGEEKTSLNPTLQFAARCGMQLVYTSRESYREKETEEMKEKISKKYSDCYVLPEGGTNKLAILGCAEIAMEISIAYDYICCPCGTGGTLSGLAKTSQGKVLGFCVLKGPDMLDETISTLLGSNAKSNWLVNYAYHFGGYAKINAELLLFIDGFYKRNSILLEPIYSGKMMFGLYDLIKKGYFKKGETIIALHTGGLQALEGLKSKMQKVRQSPGYLENNEEIY